MIQPCRSEETERYTRRQIVWYFLFRVIAISLFLGGTVVYHLRADYSKSVPDLSFFYLLAGVSYFVTLVSLLLLHCIQRFKTFIHGQLVCDTLFVSFLIYLTGGSESLFSVLFLLIVVGAAFFLSRYELFVIASASAIIYGSLIDLQYYRLIPLPSRFGFPATVDIRDVFFSVFVHVIALFLVALLGGTLAERLRRSQAALAEKAIDYEELEELNREILSNIGSGLMVIDSLGTIRSFNASAERITGIPFTKAYGNAVKEIFPDIPFYDGSLSEARRAEGNFVDRDGVGRILGYNASFLSKTQTRGDVLLVSFQDLTHVKRLEEQLKRADRLAVAGQLASGMAHEIRNPLASISGSLQLLMEEKGVSEEQQRLMGIVVKEAERLSSLLTDFLIFARPRPLEISEADLSSLLDELADIAGATPAFSSVEIVRDYPIGERMRVDRDQIRQALWNLLINASEAMGGEGRIVLGIDAQRSEVYVQDSGPGIPDEIISRIFDPFFTTKEKGSGLGLATVYTIVDAHGGEVLVDSRPGEGTRFTLSFSKEGT